MRTRLDPADWEDFRARAHAALDSMIDYQRDIRARKVWTAPPPDVRAKFRAPLPRHETPLGSALAEFETSIKPYATGNQHPAFMAYVHGAGTPFGMVAEMLAAGLNANCGGRDHIGLEVERQITRWSAEMFGLPPDSSGLCVTGSSLANFLGVLVARTKFFGATTRRRGLSAALRPRAYASRAAHHSLARAMDMAGLGADRLRLVPCGPDGAMDLQALREMIAIDRAAGWTPFFLAATAGTADRGGVDPLEALADLASEQNMWLHVDGALGGLAVLSPTLKPLFSGIERADSIAFDFHKWGQVPYAAGFFLCRDAEAHKKAFAIEADYLTRATQGLSAGENWPCDFGPDLSRSFAALKIWFTLKILGVEKLGRSIDESCALARRLARRIEQGGRFTLKAPVTLNIVCFGLRGPNASAQNREIVEALQLAGVAAPSMTMLNGEAVIRCALVNHRTEEFDLDLFLAALEQAADQADAAA